MTVPDEGSGTGQGASDTAGEADGAEAAREIPVIEGYRSLREIGRGGFSSVFAAQQVKIGRWVAIKVLDEAIIDDEAVEDFERECLAMGRLSDHPNIVTVHDSAFTADRRPCIVMELLSPDYWKILQDTGPLSLDQLLPVSVRIAAALATAHNRGIVHGDVKPQNILYSKYEIAALGDFGIANLVSHRGGNQQTGMSPYYVAPEIIGRDVEEASPFADQYSLAATIYTLASGSRPYEGDGSESTGQVFARTLKGPPPRLRSEHLIALDEVLHKAMSRRRRDRFRDLRQMAEALVEIETQLGLDPTPIDVRGGRYLGGVVDLSGSASRSGEPFRDRSIDRSAATGPQSARAESTAGGGSGGAPPPTAGPVHSGGGAGPIEPVHASEDVDFLPAAEETIVRPRPPTVLTPSPEADASPAAANRKRPRRGLRLAAALVIAAAAAAAAVWMLTNNAEDSAAPSEPVPTAPGDLSADSAAPSEPTASEAAALPATSTPAVKPTNADPFMTVSAGYLHSCGLRTSGEVECWGDNHWGQSKNPEGKFSAVSAGFIHSCGLRTSGDIECWGGTEGRSYRSKAAPYTSVSVDAYGCGILDNNTIDCWSLGIPAFSRDSWCISPDLFDENCIEEDIDTGWALSNTREDEFVAVSASATTLCGLRNDFRVACWGDIGSGREQSFGTNDQFIDVSANILYTCGLRPTRLIDCWEDNGDAILSLDIPQGLFTDVSGRHFHFCGLRIDGTVKCWGINSDGETDEPSGIFVSVSAGGHHSCGVRSDGTIKCWGNDSHGQLDTPEI